MSKDKNYYFQAAGSPSSGKAVDIDEDPFWKEKARKAAKQKALNPVPLLLDNDEVSDA